MPRKTTTRNRKSRVRSYMRTTPSGKRIRVKSYLRKTQ